MDDFNERDLFAGLAMCGLVANRGWNGEAEYYAKYAYEIAEAMLKEKEKRDDNAS